MDSKLLAVRVIHSRPLLGNDKNLSGGHKCLQMTGPVIDSKSGESGLVFIWGFTVYKELCSGWIRCLNAGSVQRVGRGAQSCSETAGS